MRARVSASNLGIVQKSTVLKRNKSICPQKGLYKNVHGGIIGSFHLSLFFGMNDHPGNGFLMSRDTREQRELAVPLKVPPRTDTWSLLSSFYWSKQDRWQSIYWAFTTSLILLIHINLYNNAMGWVPLLSPFYRWKYCNWGTLNFFRVMRLVNSKDLCAESQTPKSLTLTQELEDPRSSLISACTISTKALKGIGAWIFKWLKKVT